MLGERVHDHVFHQPDGGIRPPLGTERGCHDLVDSQGTLRRKQFTQQEHAIDLDQHFTAVMDRLGPFEPRPHLAVAASGGADSSALCLLAERWVHGRGGSLLALIVDHTLRPNSVAEAALTANRLAARGIAVRQLRAADLSRGPALADRARTARYRLLTAACADAGILHLLLGHHAADQAETVMIRALGHSADRGLAAMPALVETATLRLLRPLLDVPPDLLRQMLTENGIEWVEDPSNRDPHALRGRLRGLRAGRDLTAETLALCAAAARAGQQRTRSEQASASALAAQVSIRPEGFAILTPGPVAPDLLAAVIQTIGGGAYPPPSDQVAALARQPRPATLAGVRLLPAGQLGPGLLVAREAAAMAPPIFAEPDAIWDKRFRLAADAILPRGATIGALGDDAAAFRRRSDLPSAVLCTLPTLRCGKTLAAVPHLLYPGTMACAQVRLVLSPPRPLAGASFFPLSPGQ